MNGQQLEADEYLPISMLNQFEYCARRFWLMYVCNEMEINAPVLEGLQQHERAHGGGATQTEDATVYRRVYVWSDELHIAGFADVVEEREGLLVPVEYKRGHMGRWLNDHVQLCAQALCLEERTGNGIPEGDIFYWASRRRVRVALTPELRHRTRAAIADARHVLAEGRMPPPIEQRAKCHDCSLEGVCLPREVQMLVRERP